MNIVSLSPSSMDAWQGCHNKFFIEQVLKWRSGNIKSGLKGTILHEVAQWLAEVKLNHQNNKGDIICPWESVEQFTISTYEKYQQQEPHHKWKLEDKKDCLNWARRVYESKYNPLNLNILEIEKWFEFELTTPEFCYTYGDGNEGFLKLRGKIDLIIKHDEDTLEILDWKSGERKDFHTKQVKELDDLYDDAQLLVYLYAVKQLYPNKNILVTIFYLREGPFTLLFGEKHIKRAKEKILEKFQKITASQQAPRQIDWKCGKICDLNRKTFDGTHIKPFVEFRNGEFTKAGELMSICQQVNYCNEKKGLEWSTQYLKKK